MHKRILVLAAALAASSAVAIAKSPADYDGDGRISREEFRNQAANCSSPSERSVLGCRNRWNV